MNIPRSFSFCSNRVFPAITDNDFKTAHLSRAVILFAAFPRQERRLSTWEVETPGEVHDDSLSEETYVSLVRS